MPIARLDFFLAVVIDARKVGYSLSKLVYGSGMRNSHNSPSAFSRTNFAVLVVIILLGAYAVICQLRRENTLVDRSPSVAEPGVAEPFVDYDPQVFRQTEDVHILPGNPNLIPGITVHGAMVITGHHLPPKTREQFLIVERRIDNARDLIKKIPFPVTEWYGTFTKPCPLQHKGTSPTERGVSWAHLRIWHEFVHFDPIMLQEYKLNKAPLRSTDGLYEIKRDGTMYKNSQRYQEDDIMVVFEDDSEIAVHNFNDTLVKELSQMETNLVLLGFTECLYIDRIMAMTSHAYAITRAGARKLIEYYEPCGPSIDLHFGIMNRLNFSSYRVAHKDSYRTSYITGKPSPNGRCGDTEGLLIQNKKTMSSINGHTEEDDRKAFLKGSSRRPHPHQ